MLKRMGYLVLFLPLILAYASMAFSQPAGGGWALLGEETTVQATVQEVQQVPGQRPGMVGVRLNVITDTGERISVLVGPLYFLEQAGYSPKVGDRITIEGFLINSDVDAILVARTITYGSTTVTLRDEQGMPLWSGGARFSAQFTPQSSLHPSGPMLARGYGRAGKSMRGGPSGAPGMGVRSPQGGQGSGVCPFGYPAGTGISSQTPQGSGVSQGVRPPFVKP